MTEEQVAIWVSIASTVVGFLGLLVSIVVLVYAVKKFNRDFDRGERARAYLDYLDACSVWWGALGDRDKAWKKRNDEARANVTTPLVDEEKAIADARARAFTSYVGIRLLGSAELVREAKNLLELHNSQNHVFLEKMKRLEARNSGNNPTGIARGTDVKDRAQALRKFQNAARQDLGRRYLPAEI